MPLIGAPDRIRTCDPRIRRPLLYPTELRGRAAHCGAARPAQRCSTVSVRKRTNLGEPLRGGWCGWCPWSMRWEPSRRTSALFAAVLACSLAVAAIPSAVGTPAPVARGTVASQLTPAEVNPLANRTWGVYKGSGDQAWTPYQRAKGQKKKLLAKIALAPKAKWYGRWIPKNQISEGARPHHERAGGRSRGARADDGLPPQAVGGGGVPSPPDGRAEGATRSGSTSSRPGSVLRTWRWCCSRTGRSPCARRVGHSSRPG